MEKNTNRFVRVLLILASLFILSMIVYNYFFVTPLGDINSGIIILLCFVLILVLSESFDNFSIGKLFSLSKEISEKKSKISELSRENFELRNQIINISTSISQGQFSANILGLPDRLIELLTVRQANKEEIEEEQKEEEKIDQKIEVPTRPSRPRIDFHKLDELGLNKFLQKNNLQDFQLIRDAKLVPKFQNIDPISDMNLIFDGYLKTLDGEIFIEVKRLGRFMFSIRDRLYVMLSKIYYYNSVKKSNAYLALILVDTKEEQFEIESVTQRIASDFQPAIDKNLLRIVKFSLNDKELEQVYRKD